jgi:RHS repeat-associated protein
MLGKTATATTSASGKVFPGQYYDAETGLHYNLNRYYDPNTGRYLTADRAGIIRNPIALTVPGDAHYVGRLNHLFAYADNNPIIATDPDGQLPLTPYTPIPVICKLIEETATDCWYECPKGQIRTVPKTPCSPRCKPRIVRWMLLKDL